MHNSIKIDFDGIALEDGGTLVKDVPYVVGLKNFHFILSNLSLGGVIQNDISAEGIVTLESVIENEGQEDEFTSYHQQIVFKNVYGYDVTIYDKSVTASLVMTPQDVIDEIKGGTLDNAKPLYFHPIVIWSTTLKLVMSCFIINNSPTPFTSETLIETLRTWGGRLLVTGTYKDGDDNVWHLSYVAPQSEGRLHLQGTYDGTPKSTASCPRFDNMNFSDAAFIDNVNKIN